MSHRHSINHPFAPDPSAPLGSLQNPYPLGAGPEDDPSPGSPTRLQPSEYVVQTPYFQHVDPRVISASRFLASPSPDANERIYRSHLSRSPSPHTHRPQLVHPQEFPSRPSSPLSPLKRRGYPNTHPSISNQTRHPPHPPSHQPQPRRDPASPPPPARHVHFADDEPSDSEARTRERRAAIARLNALSTSDPPRSASGNGPPPPARALSHPPRNPPPPPLGPAKPRAHARVARSPARGDGGLRRDRHTPHADLLHRNFSHHHVPPHHRRPTPYPPDDVHDARRASASALGNPASVNAVAPDDPTSVNARADYDDTVAAALPEPPMWELCALCEEKPHLVQAKGALYCRACYGVVCAAERAPPWERCWVCGEKPGVLSQGGSRFCNECFGEACAAEGKREKERGRGRGRGRE